jgi:16S rRNA (guanine527-N7)-methyltransferase
VKHPFNLEDLFSFLNSQSIVISEKQKDQFQIYLDLLKIWTRKQNLVSKKDIHHLIERHFFPSAFLAFSIAGKIDGKLIDIGTGAGFPGVILKIFKPDISLTLLDSSRKKVLFLEEVCEQLALDCPIIKQRCEKYTPQAADKFRIVISRAVANLDLLWRWSGHLIEKGGRLYAIKGGDYKREIDDLTVNHLKIEVLSPPKEWLMASNYLNHKYIIKLET